MKRPGLRANFVLDPPVPQPEIFGPILKFLFQLIAMIVIVFVSYVSFFIVAYGLFFRSVLQMFLI